MTITIIGITTPKGYSDQFQYFSITSESPIQNENEILSGISDFPYFNKIVTTKERIDDWLITASK